MAFAQVEVPPCGPHPRLTRRRSEAEILSYEIAAKTSHRIQHLNLNEDFDNPSTDLNEKVSFNRSNSETVTGAEYVTPAPKVPPPMLRRASLSALEESHLSKAMLGGSFQSEAERARKARRKSFDKVRRRSSEEEKRARKELRKNISPIPDG